MFTYSRARPHLLLCLRKNPTKSTISKPTNSTLEFYHFSQNIIKKAQMKHGHSHTCRACARRSFQNVTFQRAKMIVHRNKAKQRRHRAQTSQQWTTASTGAGQEPNISWYSHSDFSLKRLFFLSPAPTAASLSTDFSKRLIGPRGLSFRHAGCVLTSAVIVNAQQHIWKSKSSACKTILVTSSPHRSHKSIKLL